RGVPEHHAELAGAVHDGRRTLWVDAGTVAGVREAELPRAQADRRTLQPTAAQVPIRHPLVVVCLVGHVVQVGVRCQRIHTSILTHLRIAAQPVPTGRTEAIRCAATVISASRRTSSTRIRPASTVSGRTTR